MDHVETIEDQGEFFTVKTTTQEFSATRIVLAIGLKETLPDIPGLSSLYGQSFFNCSFCDGWEMKDKKLGVIIEQEEFILHFVPMIFHWNQTITVLTNGISVNKEIKQRLNEKKSL